MTFPLVFLAAALLGACGACSQPPAPPAPSPGPTVLQACGELVEAGCLAGDDSGDVCEAVLEQLQGDADTLHLGCLLEGGTISSCGVPCQ